MAIFGRFSREFLGLVVGSRFLFVMETGDWLLGWIRFFRVVFLEGFGIFDGRMTGIQ